MEKDYFASHTGSADDDLDRDVNDELRARVKSELTKPGERLLWAGRSSPPLAVPGLAFYFVGAASLVVLVIGIISCAHAMGRPKALPDEGSMALGSLFCVVGALLSLGLIGNLFHRRNERRRNASVCYAVSDRRVIMWVPEENSDGVRVYTLPGAQLRNIVRVQRPDGSGDLEFSGTRPEMAYDYRPLGFKHILDVRRVEQIIRKNLMTEVKGTQFEHDRSEPIGEITW